MRWKHIKPWDNTVHWQEYEFQSFCCTLMNKIRGHDKWWSYAADMNGLADTPERLEWAAALGLKPGEPDIRLNFLGGRMVFVELKRVYGEVSDEQEDRHKQLRKCGFVVEVVYAYTPWDAWTQLEAIINRHMRIPLLWFLW